LCLIIVHVCKVVLGDCMETLPPQSSLGFVFLTYQVK